MAEQCKYLNDLPKNQITDKLLKSCLEEIINKQQGNNGFVAVRGICELCKIKKQRGQFNPKSFESLTRDTEND